MNNIAILLPYKDQFIKDNAGSASIWVKDFSKTSRFRNLTTVFGYTSNTSKVLSITLYSYVYDDDIVSSLSYIIYCPTYFFLRIR